MRDILFALAVLLAAAAAQAQDKPPSVPEFHIDYVIAGTADAWRDADAVVYLRIEETRRWKEGRVAALGGLSVQQTAKVISVLKPSAVGGPTAQTVTFLQAGSTSERPYAKGEEFIAFLEWSAEAGLFVRAFGPASLYPVKNGQVVWLHLGGAAPRTETMRVEDFIAKLKALEK